MNLMSPTELSAELAIPEGTLAQWRYLGKGPAFIRVGRHVRYRKVDVDNWLAQKVRTSTKRSAA